MKPNSPPKSPKAPLNWFTIIRLSFYLFLLLIVLPLYTYLFMPVWSFSFAGLPFEIFIFSLLFAVLETNSKGISKLGAAAVVTALLSFVYLLFMWLGSWGMFRWQSYRDLIGEVKQGESLSADLSPVSLDQIRIVDKDMAERLGDKVLGERPAMGSQVYLGEFTIQQVRGKLYWVAPLLHSGFFKWSSNSHGTPGYVMVSATDERDVQLITQIKGRNLQIKYQAEAYFGSYLPRHVYFNGYYTMGTTDFNFEIDDEGEPHWVITLYKHTIGFSGNEAYGVIVVHAETGAIQEYDLNNAPAWVDRIQPLDFIQNQLDDWGQYVQGYWNFSGEGKLTTTSELSLIYSNDGQSYWYTGLTSIGRDQGTVGFALVNTRNKQAVWYAQAGATEGAAQLSAAGKVQEKGYKPSKPIMYNVNGVATYVMSLKDRAGLVKMVAMVSVEDFSIVGVGDNLNEALRSYKQAYNSAGRGGNVLRDNKKAEVIEGRVARINADITGGNSYYFLNLEQVPNKIFIGSSTLSPELVLTKVGDMVRLRYEDARLGYIDLVGFENQAFKAEKTDKISLQDLGVKVLPTDSLQDLSQEKPNLPTE